jgi:hypothetical protein
MKTLCNVRGPLVLAAALLLLTLGSWTAAFGQLTPSDDTYVNSAKPTINFGTSTTLNLQSAAETSYIRFDLTAVPAGSTGASIAKATLKLYVNSVTTAGSFNVDYVNGTWAEQTITYSLQPAIGTTIASSVPLTTANKGKYVEIDVTAAVVAWLNGTEPNDGIALVANSPLVATFDSKENTGASHPPEIDIVYAGIAGVTTASGSGLTGGGTSGTLNLALTNTCSTKQVLQWNGSSWACAAVGTGTITGVTAGSGLSGGGSSGTVTLNLDTTKVPLLSAANTFTGIQSVTGNVPNKALVFVDNTSTAGSNSSGVWGQTDSNDFNAAGVWGVSSSVSGAGFGVVGDTASTNAGAHGVIGVAGAYSGGASGVYGLSSSPNGVGVWGVDENPSHTGLAWPNFGRGVWGDTASSNSFAILGTADDSPAGYFINNSPSQYYALFAESDYATASPFGAYNNSTGLGCNIDNNGNLNCTGAKHAVVPIDGGQRKVALSAIESPKNWFEDFGSAQLSAGAATVALDADFAQTVNTGVEYHVFLTPRGECDGLYVASTTASGFEVRELHHGSSSVAFDYRIVALRKNFENIRLEDHTKDPDPAKFMNGKKKGVTAKGDMKPLMPLAKPAPETHSIAQKTVR